MGLGIPGRNGSARSTELGALNEIIRKLTEVRNSIDSSGGAGGATLAEQQSQTTLLTDIETNTNGLEGLLILIEAALNTANAPSHIELTNPTAVNYTAFKELSFVCSGTIDVTLDGNTITYPYTLGTSTILGSTIKADIASTNAIEFDGTGTVLITIQ